MARRRERPDDDELLSLAFVGKKSKQPVKIQLPPLHPRQREIAEDPARFRVVSAGRRFGKTRMSAMLCLVEAIEGRRAWWIAPTYKMASVGWRDIRGLAAQVPILHIRENDKRVEGPSGGFVEVRSADAPQSLRGEGLDFVVFDECALISEEAWTEAIRPALSDRKGRALFISTPKGRTFFWRLWSKGQDEDDESSDWKSWQIPSSDSPFMDPKEIAEARNDMSEEIFDQEYMARFIEHSGTVFRNVYECATGDIEEPHKGEFVVGLDWGKSKDFTVAMLYDPQRSRVVDMDRFNKIDYVFQLGRVKTFVDRWVNVGAKVKIVAERNAMGDILIETMRRPPYNMYVTPFDTTNVSKPQLIEHLALKIERQQIVFPDNKALIGELLSYEATRTAQGYMTYSAPKGSNDDTVIALALAVWHGRVDAISGLLPNEIFVGKPLAYGYGVGLL